MTLARDFDGAIYIDEVHPPTGFVEGTARRLMRIGGFVAGHAMAFSILAASLVVWIVVATARFFARSVRRFTAR